jgi:ribosome-binding factor A
MRHLGLADVRHWRIGGSRHSRAGPGRAAAGDLAVIDPGRVETLESKMPHNRPGRVAELIHAELARILLQRVSDPRLVQVSITRVDVSPDLRTARVYVLPLGKEDDAPDLLAGLGSAKGFLRKNLGEALALRHVPDLVFCLDKGLADAVRLTHILVEMEAADAKKAGDPEE